MKVLVILASQRRMWTCHPSTTAAVLHKEQPMEINAAHGLQMRIMDSMMIWNGMQNHVKYHPKHKGHQLTQWKAQSTAKKYQNIRTKSYNM